MKVRFVEIEPFDGIEGDTCTYIDMDLITKTFSHVRGERKRERERVTITWTKSVYDIETQSVFYSSLFLSAMRINVFIENFVHSTIRLDKALNSNPAINNTYAHTRSYKNTVTHRHRLVNTVAYSMAFLFLEALSLT